MVVTSDIFQISKLIFLQDNSNNEVTNCSSSSASVPLPSNQLQQTDVTPSAQGPSISSSSSASNSPPPTPPLRTRTSAVTSSTSSDDNINSNKAIKNSSIEALEESVSSLSFVSAEAEADETVANSSESSSSTPSSSSTSLSEEQAPNDGCDENGHETQENVVDHSRSNLSLMQSMANEHEQEESDSSSTWSLSPGDEAITVDENNHDSEEFSFLNGSGENDEAEVNEENEVNSSTNGNENENENENEDENENGNDNETQDGNDDINGARQDSLESHDSIRSDSPSPENEENSPSTSQGTDSCRNDDNSIVEPSQNQSVQITSNPKQRHPTRPLHRRAYSTAGVFSGEISCYFQLFLRA